MILDNEGTKFLRKVGYHSPNDKESYPRRSEYSVIPLREPESPKLYTDENVIAGPIFFLFLSPQGFDFFNLNSVLLY
jgi:hypothetical protein